MLDIYIKDETGATLYANQVEGYRTQQYQVRLNDNQVMTISITFSANKQLSFISEKEQAIFNKIAAYISDNLSENLSIQQLATLAGMNRTKLQANFKLIFGKTLNSFTKELKMQKAKELLIGSSTFSLKEVAAMIGYKYTNHFSAAFKKHFNCPPSALKAKPH
jgi:AraC-like DNA-binding protein